MTFKEKEISVDVPSENVSIEKFDFWPSFDKHTIRFNAGNGGAYCTNCPVSKLDGNDPHKVLNGFEVNRDIKKLNATYKELEENGYFAKTKCGNFKKSSAERHGLTKAPLFKELPVTKVSLFWKSKNR